MSMHLEKITVQFKSKVKKSNSKRLIQAKQNHEAWLKAIGVGKTKNDKKNLTIVVSDTTPYRSTKPSVSLSNKVAGHGAAKAPNIYSGERKLLGIATMHKSNMVPVFADKKQDAIDIAQMRRN